MEIKGHISRKAGGWLYLFPLAILLIVFVIQGQHRFIGDFGNYYYAAKFLFSGNWGAWVYDPASFNEAIYKTGQRDFLLNLTPVPPLSALLLIPITFAGAYKAKLIWNILNACLFVFTVIRIRKHYPMPDWIWACLPILFYIPLRGNFYEGQLYILLFYTLTEGYIQYEKGNFWMAAGLWGFGIHLKIITVVILFFLLLQKEIKSLVLLVVSLVILLLLSLPFIGFEIWYEYLTNILPRLFSGEINNPYAQSYQSMQVLLKTIFIPDVFWNPNSWYNKPALYYSLLQAFKAILLSAGIWCTFSDSDRKIKFSLWLFIALLISGYGNTFSLLLLLLPLVFLYPFLIKNHIVLFAFITILFLGINLPYTWFNTLEIPLRFPRLYALIALLCMLLWLCRGRIQWYYLLLPVAVAFIPSTQKEAGNNYFLAKDEALLITDFDIEYNQLVIQYFNIAGPGKKTIPLEFKVDKQECSTLTVSMEKGRKKKCEVNDSLEIFLSDENRGVGLNTLRYKLLKEQRK